MYRDVRSRHASLTHVMYMQATLDMSCEINDSFDVSSAMTRAIAAVKHNELLLQNQPSIGILAMSRHNDI